MAQQGSLFDGATGRERKEAGIAQVSLRAEEFLTWVRREAKRISHEFGSVSVNDLRPLADRMNKRPHHLNAWGAVFHEAGWIPVGRTYARRPESNARQVQRWKWTR